MKKNFLYGVLAILSLVACSQDEMVDENRSNDEITFNVVTNKATRAADVYCNENKPGSFYVYARYDGKDYIKNDEIKKVGNTWENQSGVRYWPAGGAVDFYAHVNGGDCFNWNDGAPEFKNFTVNDDVAKQTDLLYAINKGATQSSDPQVLMNFRHALSQIVFKAKNTNADLHVVIDAIRVCHLDSKTGTFAFSSDANTEGIYADPEHDDATTETYLAAGTWNLTSGADVSYEVSFNDVTLSGKTNETNLTNSAHNVAGPNKAMMLMPQSASAWTKTTNTNGFYFAVKCAYYNIAGNTYDPTTDIRLWPAASATENTEYVIIPADITWEQGKKYIYTFVFGQGNGGLKPDKDPTDPTDPDPDPDPTDPEEVLVPITFTVTVDDFEVVLKDVNMTVDNV